MTKQKLFCVFFAASFLSFAAEAKLYKWVDDKGVTHYGETVPAEYANKDRSELNKTGRVVSTTDVLTPEEHRAKEAADAKRRADLEAERNAKLHDSSLLNTYSNVKEIDLARARNVQQLDARGQVSNKQLGEANKTLTELKAKADSFAKTGKPIPAYLKEDLDNAQAAADKLGKEVATINADKAALEARYDADKARYKLLTGK